MHPILAIQRHGLEKCRCTSIFWKTKSWDSCFRRACKKGVRKGRQEGELTVLRRQIEKRFGALPSWAGEKLAASSASELEDLAERVLDAKSVAELLR